jgi:hypothetical protein
MASFDILAIILTGIGLTISLVYYASVLRNQNTTRKAQYFMQFTDRFHTPETLSFWVRLMRFEWEDLEDFERKYGSVDHPDLFGERYSFWAGFNNVGWLVEKGIIQLEDVNTMIGPMLFWTWDKFKPIIYEHRVVYNYPDQYIYWERLYDKLVEYRKKNNIYGEAPENYDDYLSTIET